MPGIYYTQKDNSVYAISEAYPWGELVLPEITWQEGMCAELLGSSALIEVAERESATVLRIPPINPDDMLAHELYTFKIHKTQDRE